MPSMPTDPHAARQLEQLNAREADLHRAAHEGGKITKDGYGKGLEQVAAEKEVLFDRVSKTDPNREVAARAGQGAEQLRKAREYREDFNARMEDIARRAGEASAE